jgi:GT2 family glycosyltransferase
MDRDGVAATSEVPRCALIGPAEFAPGGCAPIVEATLGACLAVRRRALDKAGLFSTETQRVKNSVGSTEDGDWENKVWQYGGYGVYVPEIVCYAELPQDRLAKSYHRRWHLGHGKFNAKADRPDWNGARRLLDVPMFMYRQAAESALDFTRLRLSGKEAQAFERECDLLFNNGFMKERWRTHLVGSANRS